MNEDRADVTGLENLKKGEGVVLDDKTKYEYGSDLSTSGVPLIDPGLGKTISIRTFQFKMNPELRRFPDDKQAIFNSHVKQIRTILWGDGLIPLEEVAPRVIINNKNRSYQIFVPCEARLNTMWMDKPKNLSKEINKSNKGKLDARKK